MQILEISASDSRIYLVDEGCWAAGLAAVVDAKRCWARPVKVRPNGGPGEVGVEAGCLAGLESEGVLGGREDPNPPGPNGRRASTSHRVAHLRVDEDFWAAYLNIFLT